MLDLSSAKPHSTNSTIDDCWNRIGVHGDGSCPELKQHAHCRNCPTYSAAALRLLDRDLSAECVADSTGHFAQVKQLEEQDTDSVVVFRIASEWFALPTPVFDEVSEQRTIRPRLRVAAWILLPASEAASKRRTRCSNSSQPRTEPKRGDSPG